MSKSLIYQEAFMKKKRLLRTMQMEEGTQAAIAHASSYHKWILKQEAFKGDDKMQGEYDACEEFLTDNGALAL